MLEFNIPLRYRNISMNMTSNSGKVEVINSNRMRYHWTAHKKLLIIDETYEPGLAQIFQFS